MHSVAVSKRTAYYRLAILLVTIVLAGGVLVGYQKYKKPRSLASSQRLSPTVGEPTNEKEDKFRRLPYFAALGVGLGVTALARRRLQTILRFCKKDIACHLLDIKIMREANLAIACRKKFQELQKANLPRADILKSYKTHRRALRKLDRKIEEAISELNRSFSVTKFRNGIHKTFGRLAKLVKKW